MVGLVGIIGRASAFLAGISIWFFSVVGSRGRCRCSFNADSDPPTSVSSTVKCTLKFVFWRWLFVSVQLQPKFVWACLADVRWAAKAIFVEIKSNALHFT